MPQSPEFFTRLIIWSAIVGWPVVLVVAWALRRRWGDNHDRLGESSSEEILDELESAYTPRRSIVIRTTTEYLPFVFEWIREVVDYFHSAWLDPLYSFWAGISITDKRDKVIFAPFPKESFRLENVPAGGRELTFVQHDGQRSILNANGEVLAEGEDKLTLPTKP